MPDKYQLKYTLDAANQLEEIAEYIVQDSPQNAATMLARIVNAIESLNMLPHRYPPVSHPGEAGDEIRSMPVRPYLVRYQIDESRKAVTVLSVRHGARRPER